MNYRENFSNRLSQLRIGKKISMKELGDVIGISDEAIRLMERAKRSPSFEVLCSLANYFDVTVDYLLGLSNDDTPASFQSPWDEAFIENLSDLLSILDSSDLEAACIDMDYLTAIIERRIPITFDRACSIADELGVSLDYLVGRSDAPQRH